ncbi:MAG: signal peptidase I [Acetivibrionales bacterium]|jgi:signal peptidase I
MARNESKNSIFHNEAFGWIKSILFAVLIAILIRGFIFEPVEVDGVSMENTLHDRQRLIVYKLGYFFGEPKTGDIIVLKVHSGLSGFFQFLGKTPIINKAIPDLQEIDYIKRVIGVPGDSIDIKNGKVYVNGNELNEPYAKGITNSYSTGFPLKVEENKVFVLGDNRQNSHDSRHIGLIDYADIKGKAVFRIWPFKDIGLIE